MLVPQIKEFIATRCAFYEQLQYKDWLIDLTFLADIAVNFNELDIKIQGEKPQIADVIGVVNAFKCKLRLLKCHQLKFPKYKIYCKQFILKSLQLYRQAK